MLLGWAIANEPVSWRTALAAAVILVGVAIISVKGASVKREAVKAPEPKKEGELVRA